MAASHAQLQWQHQMIAMEHLRRIQEAMLAGTPLTPQQQGYITYLQQQAATNNVAAATATTSTAAVADSTTSSSSSSSTAAMLASRAPNTTPKSALIQPRHNASHSDRIAATYPAIARLRSAVDVRYAIDNAHHFLQPIGHCKCLSSPLS